MNRKDSIDRPLYEVSVTTDDGDPTPPEYPSDTLSKQAKAPSTLKLAHQVLDALEMAYDVDPPATIAAADRFLERKCPQFPELVAFYEGIPSDAEFFAHNCCERMAGEILWCLLERFSKEKIQSLTLRKKIFWKIWDTFDLKVRASFLAWVQRESERGTDGG